MRLRGEYFRLKSLAGLIAPDHVARYLRKTPN